MSASASATLSLNDLFAEREARRRRDKEAEEQLNRREQEELAAFRKRLDEFVLTEDRIRTGLDRIRRAFLRGETELMITSFPCSFCDDWGRAIGNAGLPPMHKLSKEEKAELERNPPWVATMPAGVRAVFEYWRDNLKSQGFGFSARIINYVDGKPGDIGVFFSWPKSRAE